MKKTIGSLFYGNRHLLLQLYWCIYLPWFAYLERTVTTDYRIIHTPFDDYIPFCEFFIIPYLLWFAYIAAAILYFAFRNKQEYYNLCKILFFGMTIFLIISTIFPNGHELRPAAFTRDNIFTDMVIALYQADTATNIFPSIHVYNSIAVNAVISRCDNFKNNPFIRYGSHILCMSIVLSTMFLKQHSVFDVVTGITLATLSCAIVYRQRPVGLGICSFAGRLRHS